MARFTDAEEQILTLITDGRLRTILASIREATEDIWSADAPRIVTGFTDHGMPHTERLCRYAVQILAAGSGQSLSAREAFLLLSGAYLHDVGMQCDTVRHPDIVAGAEKLGANFHARFEATSANAYSVDEQTEIRRNHQFLSAAWIEHAFNTGKTVLGRALNGFPDELVGDLCDICKYHSTLPITECPQTFTLDPTGRKQLVATVLRFSDELDVDGKRVSLATAKDFGLEPENGLYWWLHNLTSVVFVARNLVRLSVRLDPDDAKTVGDTIEADFLSRFRDKNSAVLSVLAEQGFPLFIDVASSVVEYEFAERLPAEIIAALARTRSADAPLVDFSNELREWLGSMGYELGSTLTRSDRLVEMTAHMSRGTIKQRIKVLCAVGEVTKEDVQLLADTLDLSTPQGWIVADSRVSDAARTYAARLDGVEVYSYSEFQRNVVWRGYVAQLNGLCARGKLPEHYVDPSCVVRKVDVRGRIEHEETKSSLDAYIDAWLIERGPGKLCLLGDYGAGKTWFCLHYASRQLQRYFDDPTRQRFPLLIPLRDSCAASSPQQLVNDLLLQRYRLPFVGGAWDVFDALNRRGRLLLLLDGLDEVPGTAEQVQSSPNAAAVSGLIVPQTKVLVTSRPQKPRMHEYLDLVAVHRDTVPTHRERGLEGFEVLHIAPFEKRHIELAADLRLAEDGLTRVSEILDDSTLAKLGGRPLLLSWLLELAEKTELSVPRSISGTYACHVGTVLERVAKGIDGHVSSADGLLALTALAWELVRADQQSFARPQVHGLMRSLPERQPLAETDIDDWLRGLCRQAMLWQTSADTYEFRDRSLVDFLTALRFASETGCLSAESKGVRLGDAQLDIGLPQTKSPPELVSTFGLMPLAADRLQAILDFMIQGLVSSEHRESLLDIVAWTGGRKSKDVRYLGANAVSLLTGIDPHLEGVDLAGAVLLHSDMHGARLDHADLTAANLRSADFRGCQMEGTSFRNADLSGADLRGCDLRQVQLGGADLAGTNLCGAFFNETDLAQAADRKFTGIIWASGKVDTRQLVPEAGAPIFLDPIFGIMMKCDSVVQDAIAEFGPTTAQMLHIDEEGTFLTGIVFCPLGSKPFDWSKVKPRLDAAEEFVHVALYAHEREALLSALPAGISSSRILAGSKPFDFHHPNALVKMHDGSVIAYAAM